jgi:hypothetical protein
MSAAATTTALRANHCTRIAWRVFPVPDLQPSTYEDSDIICRSALRDRLDKLMMPSVVRPHDNPIKRNVTKATGKDVVVWLEKYNVSLERWQR